MLLNVRYSSHLLFFYPSFFFFNDTATTEIYTLSLHDALPIFVTENCIKCKYTDCVDVCPVDCFREGPNFLVIDRKSTRLNSSHTVISYAVFCLKKKKK